MIFLEDSHVKRRGCMIDKIKIPFYIICLFLFIFVNLLFITQRVFFFLVMQNMLLIRPLLINCGRISYIYFIYISKRLAVCWLKSSAFLLFQPAGFAKVIFLTVARSGFFCWFI